MSEPSGGDRFVLMWSGGKDAMLAHDVLHSQSPRRIDALLTTIEEGADTVTMHGTPLALIERQADALGLPLHVMRVPPNAPNSIYEERLERTLRPFLQTGTPTIVAGDLFLQDIRNYREHVFQAMGARSLFPLWQRDTRWLAHRFVERGYQAVVTSVDSTQLDPGFLGRTFDATFLDDLPENVDPCGENGEFHTFVADGPPFAERVPIVVGETHEADRMRQVRLHTGAGEEGDGPPERGEDRLTSDRT